MLIGQKTPYDHVVKLEKTVARKPKTQAADTRHQPFPPEADDTFGLVAEADIAAWRERLTEKYGITTGKLKVTDDPFAAV